MITKKDPDITKSYVSDYSNIQGGFCRSVIFPQNEDEVTVILKAASRGGDAITISGAGTGVTGARVPMGGDILSTEKINTIHSVEIFKNGEGLALVDPGVTLSDLLFAAKELGLFYPPNPTERSSSVGGNIATSASGARSFRFGTTRDYVVGLRVALSSGEVIDINRGEIFYNRSSGPNLLRLPLESGGYVEVKMPGYKMPRVKNASGYYVKDGMDAVDLFIGQEGTLGVITKVKLRLIKRPEKLIDCYAFFSSKDDALNFADRARLLSAKNSQDQKEISPMSLEFFDEYTLRLLSEKHKHIPSKARACIFFEQGCCKEYESEFIDLWAKLIIDSNGSLGDTWFGQTDSEIEELESIRHDVPDMVNAILKQRNMIKVGTDIAVRPDNIRAMINYYQEVLSNSGMEYLIFGHIGDCHLHVNILPKDDRELKMAKEAYELFIKKALGFGGSVSAEHGIGKLKHAYLNMMYGEEAVAEMAELKKSLDPACILGLDNIFPKRLLQ